MEGQNADGLRSLTRSPGQNSTNTYGQAARTASERLGIHLDSAPCYHLLSLAATGSYRLPSLTVSVSFYNIKHDTPTTIHPRFIWTP